MAEELAADASAPIGFKFSPAGQVVGNKMSDIENRNELLVLFDHIKHVLDETARGAGLDVVHAACDARAEPRILLSGHARLPHDGERVIGLETIPMMR